MTPDEQDKMVQDLETSLDRLQALYNQYFMGIERLEPTVQRKEVERKVQLLRREKISNTALRFRFQTQVQKYNTQSNYWKRISRQIEEGTYQRDVGRAQKRTETRNEAEVAERALRTLDPVSPSRAPAPELTPQSLEIDDPFSDAPPAKKPARESAPAPDPEKTPLPVPGSDPHILSERLKRAAQEDLDDEVEDDEDLSSFFLKRPSIPPPVSSVVPPRASGVPAKGPQLPRPKDGSALQPKSAPQPRSAAEPAPAKTKAAKEPSPALSEDRMKAIYRSYIAARKKTNEPTDNISYAKIAALLKKQVAEKSDIGDFKVVIRNGKAIIKTVKD
jgi:hypothetical protein